DPANQTAKDYMERVGAGGSATEAPLSLPPEPKFDDIFADEALESSDERSAFGVSEPPSIPSPQRAAGPAKSSAARPSRQTPLTAIIAVVGLLVLGAVGWFVWSKFMGKPVTDPAVTQATLQHAIILAQAGKYDQAISTLQEIKPEDPQHDRAITMIADYQHKKTQAAEMVEGRPAGVYYQEQMSAGRAAFETKDYDRAKKAFEQALRVRALPADARQMYDTAAQQAAKLDSAKALFNERKYQDAINNLQAMLTQDPQNKSIQRMLIDAHFNLGATARQEERLPEALQEFDNVLKSDPNDELAKRSRELASRYGGQKRDLLYKIYVKYLPLRQVS
ncbi:MAG: tetratricopeptide repeat protein, partial [Thermoanaerobaculia bacterium]